MTTEQSSDEEVTRRRLISKAAVVTAGVAALGVAGVVEAKPARAGNGDPIVIGATNVGTNETFLFTTTSTTESAAFAVENNNGTGGLFEGSTVGADISGTQSGSVGATVSGGIGMQVSGTGGDGVDTTTSVAAKSAIYAHHEGDANHSGWGVFGSSQNGPGVHAEQYGTTSAASALEAKTHGTGNAVNGTTVLSSNNQPCGLFTHAGSGAGVRGQSTSGAGGTFQGGRSAINLVPKSGTGRPTSGKHTIGDLVLDSAGSLFLCTATGTPGTWVKVSVTSA